MLPMNLNTLNEFRHAVYDYSERAGDALFNTVDALSSESGVHSFPELSLSPLFVRRWPSLYEAFEDGKIDAEQLRQVFVQFAPLPGPWEYVFLGVDTCHLYRREAESSADRKLLPLPNVPEGTHAVCAGWVISRIVLLPQEAGQATFVSDSQRVASSGAATQMEGRPIAGRGRSVGATRPVSPSCFVWPRWRPVVCCTSKAIASFTVPLRLGNRVNV
jgi:hypothetical protein